jgi:hypothetical protein
MGMVLVMRCTSVALKRNGRRIFASEDLDHIYLIHTPRGQGVADGVKIAALLKHILFSCLDRVTIRIQLKHDTGY